MVDITPVYPSATQEFLSTLFGYIEGSLGALLMLGGWIPFLLLALICALIPKDSFKRKWGCVITLVILAFAIPVIVFFLRNLTSTFFPSAFEYEYTEQPAITAEP